MRFQAPSTPVRSDPSWCLALLTLQCWLSFSAGASVDGEFAAFLCRLACGIDASMSTLRLRRLLEGRCHRVCCTSFVRSIRQPIRARSINLAGMNASLLNETPLPKTDLNSNALLACCQGACIRWKPYLQKTHSIPDRHCTLTADAKSQRVDVSSSCSSPCLSTVLRQAASCTAMQRTAAPEQCRRIFNCKQSSYHVLASIIREVRTSDGMEYAALFTGCFAERESQLYRGSERSSRKLGRVMRLN